MEHLVATVALIGLVIVVASLLTGFVERLGIPLAAAFLLLGAAVGPYGFGIRDIGLRSTELAVLATLGLTLVLFSDAVGVNIRELREHRRLAWVILIPGTLLPALIIALAGYWLLGISGAGAAILGAALASTDPVLLRSVLRAPALPVTARAALRTESGMNDAMLLPITVLAILAARGGTPATLADLGHHVLGLFVLGPALGAVVGWAGITMLTSVRDRIGVRRDYESLFAIGLGFAAYAAAESVGGSGFLAAFAAGLAIAALDVELCDCFLEYGEATGEMLLLLTFVALGTSVIWSGLSLVSVKTIAFAVVALLARTVVLYPALTAVGVRGRDRRIIAWFGPRGLSTLLLALLPVFANVPGADAWFRVTCLVVLLSLAIHGTIIGRFLRRSGKPRRAVTLPVIDTSTSERGAPAAPTAPAAPATSVAAPDDGGAPGTEGDPERITIAEARALAAHGQPVVFVDARASRSYEADARQITGSMRLPPDDPVRAATEIRLSQRATLVVYCA
jgi:NhaP-type Na+/H+ or K+/H+ antiporter